MSGEISQSALAALMLTSVALGFAFAALYDLLRIRRIAINIPILRHVEDFLFMTCVGVSFAVAFYAHSSGKVRGFAFAGGLLGMLVYRKTLGRLVMAASERIINFVKRVVRRIVLPPIRFAARLIRRFAAAVVGAVKGVLGRIELACARRRTKKRFRELALLALGGFEDQKIPKKRTKTGKRKRNGEKSS